MNEFAEIYLRPLQREDALTSWRWRNDPEVWKYTRFRPNIVITPEIELEWIDKVLADAGSRRFAICLRQNDQYVGNTQLTDIANGSAEFHIFIGERTMWHKGIASQATRKMLAIAQNELGLKQVKLWVDLRNSAALKAYQKNGFRPVDESGNMVMDFNG